VLFAALLAAPVARAEEGMWMLHQLPSLDQDRLRAMGLELTPRQIWDPGTQTGLASAVCSLGGCSAAFVSPDGLIATNHHCAFRAIQVNASTEHDYISEGFLAATRNAELPASGYHVYVFKGYEDVTAAVHAALGSEMSPEQRVAAIESVEKRLLARCEQDGSRCRFAEMFGGLEYYLFRTMDIRDVRLVYAPPRAIGEYGGEVDNWVWPRHTGDFSFLRAYVAPDGAPADFAPENVPFRPDRWLKPASTPLREGDFAMILGYPGTTKRYRIAAAVAADSEHYYPLRNEVLGQWIRLLENQAKVSKGSDITLASKIKGYANGLKNGHGMLDGLRRLRIAENKRAREQRLEAWIAADAGRRARWGEVLPRMEALVAGRQATRDRDFLLSYMSRSSSLLSAALTIQRWAEERARPDAEREPGYQLRDEANARQRLALLDRSFEPTADRMLLEDFIRRVATLPADQRLAAVDTALAATGKTGDAAVAALATELFAGTRLADADARMRMFSLDQDALVVEHDAMVDFARSLRPATRALDDANKRYDGDMVTLEPQLIEALAGFEGRSLYPDANSTLRLTYASVKGVSPRDGISYTPFTTLSGVVEKHTGVDPFDCPTSLLNAFAEGRRGPYVDARLGDVPACFLTTHDTTGGNSGSPVMNGRGELVGLLFDGTIESMTSDYAFDDTTTRSISVDLRYMLWIMDYVDKAHALLREMGITPASMTP